MGLEKAIQEAFKGRPMTSAACEIYTGGLVGYC